MRRWRVEVNFAFSFVSILDFLLVGLVRKGVKMGVRFVGREAFFFFGLFLALFLMRLLSVGVDVGLCLAHSMMRR